MCLLYRYIQYVFNGISSAKYHQNSISMTATKREYYCKNIRKKNGNDIPYYNKFKIL